MLNIAHLRLGPAVLLICLGCQPSGFADDTEPANRAQDANSVLEEMRNLMQRTTVSILSDDAGQPSDAELVDQPLMRYIQKDIQVDDSTLWVWTHQGLPVAIQKLEVNGQTGGNWTYCFASLSADRINVEWPNEPAFASERGVEYLAIDDGPEPRATKTSRSQQLRALARRFTAHADQGPQRKFLHDFRLLPRPIFEYEASGAGVTQGAVFGFATGTNPDALVVIELRKDADGGTTWYYAPIRMTSAGVVMKLDDTPVYDSEGRWPQQRFPTWMYAFVGRTQR